MFSYVDPGVEGFVAEVWRGAVVGGSPLWGHRAAARRSCQTAGLDTFGRAPDAP